MTPSAGTPGGVYMSLKRSGRVRTMWANAGVVVARDDGFHVRIHGFVDCLGAAVEGLPALALGLEPRFPGGLG